MTNYTFTEYATDVAAETAIELLETTTKFDLIAYKEKDAASSKFIMISPAPNTTA